MTDNLSGAPVDYAVFVPDTEVIKMVRLSYVCLTWVYICVCVCPVDILSTV